MKLFHLNFWKVFCCISRLHQNPHRPHPAFVPSPKSSYYTTVGQEAVDLNKKRVILRWFNYQDQLWHSINRDEAVEKKRRGSSLSPSSENYSIRKKEFRSWEREAVLTSPGNPNEWTMKTPLPSSPYLMYVKLI